jgi:hypothetical protein
MIRTISKFHQIKIIPKSLVVLDIDETIIKFQDVDKKWWKNKFNKYYRLCKDYDLADRMAHKDWIKLVSVIDPILVDENIHDWITLIKNNDCPLILLTARSNILCELTSQHLNKVNLNIEKDRIYFNENKGDELYKVAHDLYPEIENIIMVDDLESNLVDIKEKLSQTRFNLHLYNMNS